MEKGPENKEAPSPSEKYPSRDLKSAGNNIGKTAVQGAGVRR
jgi:hypothetical protein